MPSLNLDGLVKVFGDLRAVDGVSLGVELVAVALAWWFVLRQLRRFRDEGWISRFT